MIKIGDKKIGEGSPIFIIAEAGVNHNGDLKTALKLVDAAFEAGADAVKFQTFRAESLTTPNAAKATYQKKTTSPGETQQEMLKKLELSFEYHQRIMNYCQQLGIIFLSTPFDFDSVELLEELKVPAYKLSSGDLSNLPFLQFIAEKQKPVIISTGMANLGEIEEAVTAVGQKGNKQMILLHCVSSYPAAYEETNLKSMLTIKTSFGLPVGYSDHTLGIEIAVAAAALGACVIEKHFTLDKKAPGPDHRASLDPMELKALVRSIRHLETALGDGIKRCMPSETESRLLARKSVVAAVDIPKGTVIAQEHLALKRPGSGLPPKFTSELMGKKVRRALMKDEIIRYNDLD